MGKTSVPRTKGNRILPIPSSPEIYAAFNKRMAPKSSLAKKKTPVSKAEKGGEYQIVKNEVLTTPQGTQYKVLEFLGKGTFGQVVKASKLGTDRNVAIKILKKQATYIRQGQIEVSILAHLMKEDSNKFNWVQGLECFNHKGHTVLVFEMLQTNLYEYVQQNKYRSMKFNAIRPIICQISKALDKLKVMGVIHADLKLENIMLVDPQNQPFRVKVIDFGSSSFRNRAVVNGYLQSRYYRAPEVLIGIHYNEAIDVWSLGCVMAELYLGWPLYPGSCEFDQIRYIVDTQGPFPNEMLVNSPRLDRYFKMVSTPPLNNPEGVGLPRFRIKSCKEYNATTSSPKSKETRKYHIERLDEINSYYSELFPDEMNVECNKLDRIEFIDLLKKMLTLDPKTRIAPADAMNSNFMTLRHLTNFGLTNYVCQARQVMQICNRDSSVVDPMPPAKRQAPQPPLTPFIKTPPPTLVPIQQPVNCINLVQPYPQMPITNVYSGQLVYPQQQPPQPQVVHVPQISYPLTAPMNFLAGPNPSLMAPQMVPVVNYPVMQSQWQQAPLMYMTNVAPQITVRQQINHSNQIIGSAQLYSQMQHLSYPLNNFNNNLYPDVNSNWANVPTMQMQGQQMMNFGNPF